MIAAGLARSANASDATARAMKADRILRLPTSDGVTSGNGSPWMPVTTLEMVLYHRCHNTQSTYRGLHERDISE